MWRLTPLSWACRHAPSENWRNPISPLIGLLLLLLALDLVITAARAGILNARYARLSALSEELGRKVDQALDLIRRRSSLRDSLRLALTLLRFAIAGLLLEVIVQLVPTDLPAWNIFLLLLLVGVLIWLLEFFVERRIVRHPEDWALRLTPLARVVALLMRPLLVLPALVANRGSAEPQQLVTITEEELRSFVDASQRQGVLEQDERKMIFSIFEFGDTLVREVMVPRIDIFALEAGTPIEEAAASLLESGYSRVPVFNGNIDNIIGVLYAKDLLKVWRAPGQVQSLRELVRPANFVPESKKLDDLLAEMQGGHIHIAIVVDEYGGVAGLVTLEDIVEEIIGEVQDEYDHGEESPHQKVSPNEFVFPGHTNLDEFNEVMSTQLSSEDADTLGGFLFGRIGRLPKVGDKWEEDGLRLTVEQISGRRIRRVRALIVDAAPPGPAATPPTEKEANA